MSARRPYTLATIVGARPQFVKASAFSRLWRRTDREILIHTGQHYDADMSDVFFKEMSIPRPDYHLGRFRSRGEKRIQQMVKALSRVLKDTRPDGVLVYGDTDSTLAGAIAAVISSLPLFHVEAGLRSYVPFMPEERNRTITDQASDLRFAPTPEALRNLAREGLRSGAHQVGDIMYDVFRYHWSRVRHRGTRNRAKHPYALVTIHRAASTDHPKTLSQLVAAVNDIPISVVWPVHPRTRQALRRVKTALRPHVRLIAPLPYLDSLRYQSNAQVILTDSGGIQKEAYFLRRPCVTLRKETEWRETLKTGHNALGGLTRGTILKAYQRVLARQRAPWPALFGRGDASVKIAKIIRAYLQKYTEESDLSSSHRRTRMKPFRRSTR